ncbi:MULTISPECIES: hypothetical protein [unclassified Myroides]|uniref:hypothetical protein n=1 Tax=unclassified Myroides TaxID=2642485 RepID=UPI003D2F6ED3
MKKQNLWDKAQEMMRIHDLEEIYLTTDGQGFTEKERADAHSTILTNKEVFTFHRERETKQVEPVTAQTTDTDNERTELLAKYETLFEKKAPGNMGVKKLKENIEAKEAELAQAAQTSKEESSTEGEDSEKQEEHSDSTSTETVD